MAKYPSTFYGRKKHVSIYDHFTAAGGILIISHSQN